MSAFLEVTTYGGICPNLCKYCPRELFAENYKDNEKFLSLDSFKLAISKLPSSSMITFSGFTEPAINPNLVDMILYAHNQGHLVQICTTLIGLTIDKYEKIKNVPFRHFGIHIPDNSGKTNINITESYIQLLKYIIKNPPSYLVFSHHCGDIHEDIKDIISHSFLLNINDRCGNLEIDEDVIKVYHSGNIYCNHSFLFNYPDGAGLMLPNGDIVLCCMIFDLKNKLGNLFQQNWSDIVNSSEMQFILDGLKDENKNNPCRKCILARKV